MRKNGKLEMAIRMVQYQKHAGGKSTGQKQIGVNQGQRSW